MFHSILITHRNRNEYLALALWSIHRSARICGVTEYEVVVIENGSLIQPPIGPRETLLVDYCEMPVFNKSRLYNLGIGAARGDVLTFLDADALVGPRWMEGVLVLAESAIVRLCYRVRYLPKEVMARLEHGAEHEIERLFADYDAVGDHRDHRGGWKYRLAFEAWRHHDRNHYEPDYQPFGNGLFSITRENLGDLRCDEGYVGKGGEDLDIALRLEHKFKGRYQGFLSPDPQHNLFCFEHPHDPESWGSAKYQRANNRRYIERKHQLFPNGMDG